MRLRQSIFPTNNPVLRHYNFTGELTVGCGFFREIK